MYRALKFSRVRVVSGVSPLTMTDIAAIVPVVVSRKSRRVVGMGVGYWWGILKKLFLSRIATYWD
ncbi:MAG: hypothetical protein DWI07_01940 [Planctomycetota bacterium]|nr:MAG: hypothetical protein DWI07_01940 [Planctomycetota bacterium]